MNAPHHCRAVLVILFTLGVASSVHAQGTPPGAADAPGIPVVSEPAAGPAPSDDALAEQLRALQGEVQAMREDAAAAAEEAELAALMAESENEVEPDVEEDLLSIYGFMDMGATRAFLAEDTIFALGAPTKASTFFMGALHTYMDARPHPHWRGLFELRYSNLPHGQQLTLGVNGDPNTNYERVNTQVTDHTNPVGSAPLVLSYSTEVGTCLRSRLLSV